ncbi:5'-nucleotidase C-terminal domain-containing protein [Schlegelella sp. S2-27]|uniref:5'-nucleotidase C-terminal domain-containing protein n=1 Tax=Caldimonas mangrovi TaxID=2944811 RepID=A0ABT0YT26_9BURK|nr:5'-nucleotidase C-terminal domain-containing protein [Caldimonas mangrovi]MCM5681906.1 5'-nucleotidase C-terminal domain-containing protein [Caldimonas mangrovi]
MRCFRFFASAAVLSLLSSLAACGGGDDDDSPSEPLEITILHVNDHHSRLDAETLNLALLNAAGARESVTVDLGGFPRVVAAIEEIAAASTNVIKIHAGDATTGDLYFNLTEGEADAALMNQVCFDSFTVGNHEFDYGDAGLKQFIDHLHAGQCKTPVLSANITFSADSPLHPSRAPDLVRPSIVIERGGQKIGLIGLTIAAKTQNASRPDAGTLLTDELAAAQAEIDRLKAQGVNKIVVQSHVGYSLETALAAQLDGVDVIVGGDSHTLLGPDGMEDYGLNPAGDYPTRVTDKNGKPVCVVQAWQYSYVVGELKVNFDAQGEVTGCTGTPHVLISDAFRRGSTPVNDADKAAMLADVTASQVLRVTTPDASATAVLQPYAAQKTAFGSEVVGQAGTNLCLRRVPGTRLDPTRSSLGAACNQDAGVIAHGGDIQQIVAEAFLQGAREFFDADVSIQNGGGVRADVAAGDVTVQKVYTVLPFKNTLVQLEATGAEIKAALEDAIDGVVANTNTGSYPYTGGLRFDVDLTQPKGSRLSNLQIRNANGSYATFDLAATYSVATTNFLADGQDFYTTLGTITGARRSDVGLDYAEVLLTYLENQPGHTLNKLPVADYSTQGFVDLP